MGNIFNEDFLDFIAAFNRNDVEYILVGGMAVILHGYVRTTGDMDIWVKKTAENYERIIKAFLDFGLPVFDMTEERFLAKEYDVWSFGREPVRIDMMTEVKGISFDDAFSTAQYYNENDVNVRFLHINTLIEAKEASGRYKDLDDIEQLKKK